MEDFLCVCALFPYDYNHKNGLYSSEDQTLLSVEFLL